MCLRNQLVYRFDGKIPSLIEIDNFLSREHLYKIQANPETITRYFDSSQKKNHFTQMLKEGCVGWFLVNEKEWVSYAWMSVPGGKPPMQIPFWVKNNHVFWIYYCRTDDKYQNKGYYKTALKALILEAFLESNNPELFIDTDTSNIPSRKAILSAGFSPAGVIKSFPFKVPHKHIFTIGTWNKKENHPELLN